MCLTSWVRLIGEDSVEEGMGQGIVGGVVIKGIGRCGSGSVVWELTEVKFEMENGTQGKVTDDSRLSYMTNWNCRVIVTVASVIIYRMQGYFVICRM